MEEIENNKKSHNTHHKKTKIVIKNKNKLYRAIAVFAAIILLIVIVIIVSNRSITIDSNTDMARVNIKKYSEEVKLYYEGLMNDFVAEYNNVQNMAWTYIYNNMIGDKTMEVLINEVNQVLSTDDWSTIGMTKNTKWRGIYRIDVDTNALLFKFETKEIEPAWITDLSVNYMIEVN